MKGGFWNSGGFRDTAKHLFVNETIREQKLDFFAILESGKDNFSAPFLKHISGGLDYQWYCIPPWVDQGVFWWESTQRHLRLIKLLQGIDV
jgi:hypothetical protein